MIFRVIIPVIIRVVIRVVIRVIIRFKRRRRRLKGCLLAPFRAVAAAFETVPSRAVSGGAASGPGCRTARENERGVSFWRFKFLQIRRFREPSSRADSTALFLRKEMFLRFQQSISFFSAIRLDFVFNFTHPSQLSGAWPNSAVFVAFCLLLFARTAPYTALTSK